MDGVTLAEIARTLATAPVDDLLGDLGVFFRSEFCPRGFVFRLDSRVAIGHDGVVWVIHKDDYAVLERAAGGDERLMLRAVAKLAREQDRARV